MNRSNRREKLQLPPCPVCHHDAGERVQSEEPPFLYRIRCNACGAMTRGYGAKTGATVAWKKGDVHRV